MNARKLVVDIEGVEVDTIPSVNGPRIDFTITGKRAGDVLNAITRIRSRNVLHNQQYFDVPTGAPGAYVSKGYIIRIVYLIE